MKTNLYEQLDFESLNQNKTSSDIFKNDNRIFFEYKNPEFYKIISSLESGLTRSGAAYYVDPVEKQAFCCSKKQRTLRLGKVIQRELTPKDFQKYNVFSENKYIIVVSRHLVDVARMSDHLGINSCLSFDEGSTATIIEANSGGMVAYVIHEKDYKFLLKSGIDIQNDEIFKDKDRGIEGIVPLSRLRIYRFVRFSNDHKSINMELAVPAEHIYGLNLNIYEIIHDFLRKNQIKSIEKIKSTDVFYTVGENTFDTSAELLLLKLTQKYKNKVDHIVHSDLKNEQIKELQYYFIPEDDPDAQTLFNHVQCKESEIKNFLSFTVSSYFVIRLFGCAKEKIIPLDVLNKIFGKNIARSGVLQNEKHTNTFEIKVFFEEIRDFGVCTIKSKFNIISKYNHLRHPDFIEIIYRELLKAKLIEEVRISYSCCRANINYDPFSFVIFEKMIMLPERMRNRPKSEIIRKIKRGIIKSQHENKHVQFHINIEKSNIELVNDILSDAIPDPRKKITISVPIEEIYKMGPSYTKLLDMEGFLTSICENI